ncbi:MAG: riboflavin synthase [Bacteroidetes bacterium]|nr:riboflavin synthase [Bacteroidota bacterium]
MFTGIVETTGKISSVKTDGGNKIFYVGVSFLNELRVDQSIAHNGVCLTVTDVKKDHYTVTVIGETLRKTNLGEWKAGDEINLERSMKVGDRLDGHIVQGHADATAECISINQDNGSHLFRFRFDRGAGIVVSKGSICVNGVSLTVVDPSENEFSVAIIPFTFKHTNFHNLEKGDHVNLEFDVVGKYITAMKK